MGVAFRATCADPIALTPRRAPRLAIASGVAATLLGLTAVVSSDGSSSVALPQPPPTQLAPVPSIDPVRQGEPAIAVDRAAPRRPIGPRITAVPAPLTWPAVAKPSTVPPVPELTAAMVAEQYAQVGRALSRLRQTHGQDATIDLWPRFRYIHLNEALVRDDRRREAANILDTLHAEVTARSRQ